MRGYVKAIASNIFVFLLILVAIEGLASFVFIVGSIMRMRPIAKRPYTRYDAELGWVNKPNVHIPDMYGLGFNR